jgi:hypothetical protein
VHKDAAVIRDLDRDSVAISLPLSAVAARLAQNFTSLTKTIEIVDNCVEAPGVIVGAQNRHT